VNKVLKDVEALILAKSQGATPAKKEGSP
jgi:hypothetical protein